MTTENSQGAIKAAYTLDNAWQHARQRLAELEAWADPGTIHHLQALGVTDGWRCLEVGGGGGSIAAWLCRRVGPTGHVLALDINTRFLDALDYPNLEVRQHNILTDELEQGAFDLVHTRLVVMHLPDPSEVLRRMAAALKPGGWLLAEEGDAASLVPASFDDTAEASLLLKFRDGVAASFAAGGGNYYYGRRLSGDMQAQGLVEVGGEGRVNMVGGGSPEADLYRLTAQQLRDGWVSSGRFSDQEADACLALFDNPKFSFMALTCMAIWGRRPLQV